MTCAVGYSEPDAGTDLASLRTRAVRDGDEWVINGSKIWNSGAQRSHPRVALRAHRPRGAPAPRHLGDHRADRSSRESRSARCTPGRAIAPTRCSSRDVRVPLSNLIGEVNRGWTYITGALDLERGALTNAGDLRRALDDLVALARRPRRDGTIPADNPAFGRRLAQAEADVEVAHADGLRGRPRCSTAGVIPTVEVSVEKIFTSELRQRIARPRHRPARPRRPAGAPQPRRPRRRPLRAAVPGRAADAIRRRHQRGPARRHRPARPRHALLRTVSG